MTDRQFWIAVRRALLTVCDIIEKRFELKPNNREVEMV